MRFCRIHRRLFQLAAFALVGGGAFEKREFFVVDTGQRLYFRIVVGPSAMR